MDQAAKPPKPGAMPGSGRSVSPTNIMPAKPPAPAPAPAPAPVAQPYKAPSYLGGDGNPVMEQAEMMRRQPGSTRTIDTTALRQEADSLGIDHKGIANPDAIQTLINQKKSGQPSTPAPAAPASPAEAVSNSGIKSTGGSYSDLYNAAMNFQRTMARPPSSPGIVADNPYAKMPPPASMATPQQQQSTQGDTQASPPPAAPQPSLPPGAPPNAIPATEETKKFFPDAAYSVPDAPAAPDTPADGVDETYRGDQPVRTLDATSSAMPTAEGVAPDAVGDQGFSVADMLTPTKEKVKNFADANTIWYSAAHMANEGLTGATNAATPTGKALSKAVAPVAQTYAQAQWGKPLEYGTRAAKTVAGATPGVKNIPAVQNFAKTPTKPVHINSVTAAGRKAMQESAEAAAKGAAKGGLKGASKFLGPASFGLEAGMVGYDFYDRMHNEGQSFTQANADMGRETADKFNDIWTTWDSGDGGITGHAGAAANKLLQVGGRVLSPVETIQMGGALAQEMGGGAKDLAGWGANKAYNVATGTSNKDRAAARSIEGSQEISNNRAAQLGQEAAQLKGSQTGPMSYSDEQKYNELLARADDARQRAAAMADETADWELGNQNWFGGGNKFQDAMNASGEELSQQIEGMQDQTLTSAQQANLESLQNRKGEIDRMSKLYDQEAGYWGGTGDFGHSVRNNVTQAKQQLINIASEMRQAQGNPERMNQLQRDMQFQNDRINQYRQWADAANQ